MKTFNAINLKGVVGRAVTMALLALSLGVVAPLAHAATSGDATIFNEATVSYTSGLATLTASDDVSVQVITLAANPTVTVDTTAQTVDSGANAVYNYTLRSNANGIDTYNLSLASVDANVTASGDAIAASSTLWGGIVKGSPIANQIELPGGSVSGLVAGVSTVEVFNNSSGSMERYTVTTITPGNAESSGTPEVNDVLVLTPVVPSPAIGIGDILATTQVGQYAVTTLTQTAGTPTTPGTDGTHTNNLTTTSTATLADNVTPATYTTSAGTSDETITTVNSPLITILKESRNVTTGTAFAAAGTTAKPGETLEYRITVTGDPAATVSNVYLTDIIPTYTTIVTGSYNAGADDVQIDFTDDSAGPLTTTTYHTVAVDGDQAEIVGGTLTATVGAGAGDASVPTGGSLDANDSAVVLFQVTVD